MDYDIDLFEDVPEPFEVFLPMPSALSAPGLPPELRRSSLTFFVIDHPGDTPELVPAQELDTKPLKDLPLEPITEKTNIVSPKADDGISSLTKPPASPRPGYKSLPPSTNAERTRPLFPDLAEANAQLAIGTTSSESSRAVKSHPGSSPIPNSARDLFSASYTQVPTSSSRTADPSRSNTTTQDYSNFRTPQSSPLISNIQTTKQPAASKPSNVPPITTNKSAIPPTFTPNASPSFGSPANTKPKHKSPLGSQPPILATDSSAKRPASQQAIANLDNAADNLATIGFLEPHGILQQYVEHTATALIEEALHQFEREEPLRAARKTYFISISSIDH